jgi:hypothetical protein
MLIGDVLGEPKIRPREHSVSTGMTALHVQRIYAHCVVCQAIF